MSGKRSIMNIEKDYDENHAQKIYKIGSLMFF